MSDRSNLPASLIRLICQQEGIYRQISQEAVVGSIDTLSYQFRTRERTFGSTKDAIISVFRDAIDLMPELPYKGAIENALNIGQFSSPVLSERRQKYGDAIGVSGRTLIRHEARGAQMLAGYVDKVLNDWSQPITGENDILRARIEMLEAEVKRLTEHRDNGFGTDV